MNTISRARQILMLPTNKGIEVIDINEIVRVEAISNYSKLYFTDGKTLVVAKVLAWFDVYFSSTCGGGQEGVFIRIHRTHLINKNFIHQYIKGTPGRVKLYNGQLIDVAKRKKTYFLKNWYAAA